MMRIALLVVLLSVAPWSLPGQIFLRDGTLLSRTGGEALRESVPAIAANFQVVTHGDSITRDKGRFNYIYGLSWLLINGQSLSPTILKRGINGISWNFRWTGEPYTNTMLQDAPLLVDPARRLDINRRWLVAFAGSNGISINGNSAATEYTAFTNYIAARIAAGWTATNIIVCTMLPRTGVTDSVRTNYNGLIVADSGAYGYKVSRLDLTVIGAPGADLNTAYFYDGIHPTEFGHAVIATNIYNVMFP